MIYKTLVDAERHLENVETAAIEAVKLLIHWESLSPEDLILSAKCIIAAGVNNYKELRQWERKNPDKGFAIKDDDIIIFKKTH